MEAEPTHVVVSSVEKKLIETVLVQQKELFHKADVMDAWNVQKPEQFNVFDVSKAGVCDEKPSEDKSKFLVSHRFEIMPLRQHSLQQQRKQRKGSKSWKFQYKYRKFLGVKSRLDQQKLSASGNSRCTVKIMQYFRDIKQLIFGEMKFLKQMEIKAHTYTSKKTCNVDVDVVYYNA